VGAEKKKQQTEEGEEGKSRETLDQVGTILKEGLLSFGGKTLQGGIGVGEEGKNP